jgi:NAD-dependent SIR2 family protein deacetylase
MLRTEPEKRYECPRCHRKWERGTENRTLRRRKEIPWCPFCDMEIYLEGDRRLRSVAFVVKDKYGLRGGIPR